MAKMIEIVGIHGSLRRDSFNGKLLDAAIALAPASVHLHKASIAEIPLYDGDRESAEGIPSVVEALKQQIAAADGLLLVTPEYNASIPGVFKNAIDWLSRPPKDQARVFGGKKVALIGATPGQGGTRLAQAAWLPVLRILGAQPWFGAQLNVAGAGKVFDERGELVDATIVELLRKFMAGFTAFVTDGRTPSA